MSSVNNARKNYYEVKTNMQSSMKKEPEKKVEEDSSQLYSLRNAP